MRPQLTPAEAARFSRKLVLGDAGTCSRPSTKTRLFVTSGDGDNNSFTTLQAAIDAAVVISRGSPADITIEMDAGIHYGPAIVPTLELKNPLFLTITGKGSDKTILSANTHARLTGVDYARTFGSLFENSPAEVRSIYREIISHNEISTGNSCVLRVAAPETRLSDFAIINSYNCDRTKDHPPEPGASRNEDGQWSDETHQAVALMLSDADGTRCTNLHLQSYQDTLYLNQSQHGAVARYFFTGSTIEGDVDFVFGPATAYFERCELISLGHRSQNSWVTAPSTPIDQAYGFVFTNGRFSNDRVGAAVEGRFKLGRQWFTGVRLTPYRTCTETEYKCRLGHENRFDPPDGTITDWTLKAVGKCVVIACEIGSHIDPNTPWDDWKGSEYQADGSRMERRWSPWFRPVQYKISDVANNLMDWTDVPNLKLEQYHDGILLGEFNNFFLADLIFSDEIVSNRIANDRD